MALLFNPPANLWNPGYRSPLLNLGARRGPAPPTNRPTLFRPPISEPSPTSAETPPYGLNFPPPQHGGEPIESGPDGTDAYAGAQDPDAPTTDNFADFASSVGRAGMVAFGPLMGLPGVLTAMSPLSDPFTQGIMDAITDVFSPAHQTSVAQNIDPGYGYSMDPGYGFADITSVDVAPGFTDPGYGYGSSAEEESYGPGSAAEVETAAHGETATNEEQSEAEAEAGGGDDSVICTVLYEAGRLPRAIYLAEAAAGARLGDDVMRGYHLWGRPVARLLRRYTWLQRPVHAIVRPYLMELITGRHGRVLRTGIKVCRTLGRWAASYRAGAVHAGGAVVAEHRAASRPGNGEVITLSERAEHALRAGLRNQAVLDHLRTCGGYADADGRCSRCGDELARLSDDEGVQDRDVLGDGCPAMGRHGLGRDRGLGPLEGSAADDPKWKTRLAGGLRATGVPHDTRHYGA